MVGLRKLLTRVELLKRIRPGRYAGKAACLRSPPFMHAAPCVSSWPDGSTRRTWTGRRA